MKEDILEYHPSGRLKYILKFHDNGGKDYEQYFDEEGRYHNTCVPDYQSWRKNGRLRRKIYIHNINGPADIYFRENGKIKLKDYSLRGYWTTKLEWENQIKNI